MSIIKELQDNLPIKHKEIISEDEYNQLNEGAQRAYRRVANTITQYYRCTSGPKKGKLASSPQSCGKRKDPAKVRHGRKVARTKGSIRIRKTKIRKRTQLSKRVVKLNKVLAKRRAGATQAQRPVKLAASFKHYLNDKILNEYDVADSNERQNKFFKNYDDKPYVPSLLPAGITMADYRFEDHKWGVTAILDDYYDGEESAKWSAISGNSRADVEREILDYMDERDATVNESQSDDEYDAVISDITKSIQHSIDFELGHRDDEKFKGVDWEDQMWVAAEDELIRLDAIVGEDEAIDEVTKIYNKLVSKKTIDPKASRRDFRSVGSANYRRWLQSQQQV